MAMSSTRFPCWHLAHFISSMLALAQPSESHRTASEPLPPCLREISCSCHTRRNPRWHCPSNDVTGKYNTAKSSIGADAADAHHESDEEKNEEATSEHRSGYELWRRILTMNMLTLNLRSPGLLASVLADLRALRITDSTWHTLQDRVLGVVRQNGALTQK